MAKVLVVEDERVVAEDIQSKLEKLGYAVCAVASSGEKAIQKTNETHPDLVLMDIVLKGKMDGTEAAELIRTQFNIPIVYLTAYADKKTLKRAKVTEPYGYILKPFESRELHTTIEMALYKHEMEKKLRESEQWLATTLKSIGDGIIATDTEGVITFVNPVAESLTGWSQKEAVGTLLEDIFNTIKEETGEHAENIVTKVIRKGSSVGPVTKIHLISKDGSTLVIESSASPITDDTGTIIGVVVAFRDITERKQAEEALQESEEKFRGIAERNFDVIYELDLEGCITYVSPAIERIAGYTPEEMLGNPIQDYVLQPETPSAVDALAKIREGETLEGFHMEIVKKDGSLASVEVNASPIIKEGTTIGSQGVVRDITQRKRAEMQLKSLFEASRLINSTMDMKQIYKFISDSVQELVGFENFIIFLVSKDKISMYPAYTSENVKGLVKGLTFSYTEGLIGQCIKTREPVLFESVRREEGEPTTAKEMRSQIAVPLIVEDECLGVLHISKSVAFAYDQKDVEVLKPLSEIITSAIRNSRLHDEIKRFNLELEERIKQRSKRVETLLNAKQTLQKETNWEKGLQTIVESMGKLGFDQVGVFLVDLLEKKLNFHTGKGIELLESDTSISLKRTDYFGVRCVTEKKAIYVKDSRFAEGKQISESDSFAWIPIIVQNEAFAALVAGTVESERIVEEEDVKDLEILAGMCAAFIDRTRILIEPVAEKDLKTKVKHWLDPAECCIVTEKKPVKSFEIFCDLVTHGVSGFVVSREYPEKLKRKYKLTKTPVLWLSRTEREDTISPDDLSKLYYIIAGFTRKSEESVILLDGLEYLITQIDFYTVLKHLQELKDTILLSNSRLIIPFHRQTLSQREYNILQREFTILEHD